MLLAQPRGFCAGVEMAIKALAWMVRVFEPPVYCYHEIVHNRLVVDRFRRLGVVFVDDVGQVPHGAPVMLSAHGSAPEVVEQARARGGLVVDAVCPLVTKVHHELKVRASKGYTVLYVGHQGHDEAVGTMAVAPDAVRLVQGDGDVEALADPQTPVALLAQTTLSHDEWAGIKDSALARFPVLTKENIRRHERDLRLEGDSGGARVGLGLARLAQSLLPARALGEHRDHVALAGEADGGLDGFDVGHPAADLECAGDLDESAEREPEELRFRHETEEPGRKQPQPERPRVEVGDVAGRQDEAAGRRQVLLAVRPEAEDEVDDRERESRDQGGYFGRVEKSANVANSRATRYLARCHRSDASVGHAPGSANCAGALFTVFPGLILSEASDGTTLSRGTPR